MMTINIDIPKNIDVILGRYSGGKISKDKLAELLDLDIYEVNELLEKYQVRSSISYERFTRGIEMAKKSGKYE